MSIEGLGKSYTPEQIAEFEKTRIQDPEQAHEEANMLQFEAGETPTVDDYDRALERLIALQEMAETEPATEGAVSEYGRKFLGGLVAGGGSVIDLIALAVLAGATSIPGSVPKSFREKARKDLVERFTRIGSDYEDVKAIMAPARVQLEKWKEEAEEYAAQQKERG
jgi:hypothetical protein